MVLPSDPFERAEALRQFTGLWIALVGEEVVAAAKTADSLFEEIDRRGQPHAAIQRVPEGTIVRVGIG